MIYLVHLYCSYGDGNTYFGYVENMEEFEKYATSKFGVTSTTACDIDEFGKGSKAYWITEDNRLVCEPLQRLTDED